MSNSVLCISSRVYIIYTVLINSCSNITHGIYTCLSYNKVQLCTYANNIIVVCMWCVYPVVYIIYLCMLYIYIYIYNIYTCIFKPFIVTLINQKTESI